MKRWVSIVTTIPVVAVLLGVGQAGAVKAPRSTPTPSSPSTLRIMAAVRLNVPPRLRPMPPPFVRLPSEPLLTAVATPLSTHSHMGHPARQHLPRSSGMPPGLHRVSSLQVRRALM
jgi:hypothetical protein